MLDWNMQSVRELFVVFAVQGDGRRRLIPSWEQEGRQGAVPGRAPLLAQGTRQHRTCPLWFESQENTRTRLSFKSLSPVLCL